MAYLIIGFVLMVEFIVGIFGSALGYSTSGITQQPNNWLLGSLQYLGSLATFQIDNMPYWISGFFLFLNAMVGIVIIRTVRGTS